EFGVSVVILLPGSNQELALRIWRRKPRRFKIKPAEGIHAQPAVVMLVRFLAGVASAGMMIFGSMIVLHHTRHPFVIAALFS
ncbi:MFS transporter, partial [Salmonella enterica subsp. enterica]|nr:MFS transporter [Salmonella enterica subsp. enterica]